MTNDIDRSFLFSSFLPALQDATARVAAATEYLGWHGAQLKLSCGLLYLADVDGEPAVAEVMGRGPGEDIQVRVLALGTTGYLTRVRGQALLSADGTLSWFGRA